MNVNLSVSFRAAFLPTLLLGFLHPALAGIRPSFSLDYCSWNATDILLVEVTPRPGVFRVTESWKGDLKAGSPVVVPELQPPAGALEISAYPKRLDEIQNGGLDERIPAQPVGSRMVLFLKKEAGDSSEQWRRFLRRNENLYGLDRRRTALSLPTSGKSRVEHSRSMGYGPRQNDGPRK